MHQKFTNRRNQQRLGTDTIYRQQGTILRQVKKSQAVFKDDRQNFFVNDRATRYHANIVLYIGTVQNIPGFLTAAHKRCNKAVFRNGIKSRIRRNHSKEPGRF